MFLTRASSVYRRSLRLVSTFVGHSGRQYIQESVLQLRSKDSKSDVDRNIYKAQCGSQSFVYKHVRPWFFKQSLELAKEFEDTCRLRMHIDYNEKEHILVYEYFRNNFLILLEKHPNIPVKEIKKILRHVGEAVKELHDKDWIHIDIKPDNILIDWTQNEQQQIIVEKVVLGDFDLSTKVPDDQRLETPYPVGNVMWRSPEGQTGKGIVKPSDVYSFGLVCIFGLGGTDMLFLTDIKSLLENDIDPASEILTRHIAYFGPLPEELLDHVDYPPWIQNLKIAAESAEAALADIPQMKFDRWPQVDVPNMTPDARRMISKMMNLHPAARTTINEVLEDPWWSEDDSQKEEGMDEP